MFTGLFVYGVPYDVETNVVCSVHVVLSWWHCRKVEHFFQEGKTPNFLKSLAAHIDTGIMPIQVLNASVERVFNLLESI